MPKKKKMEKKKFGRIDSWSSSKFAATFKLLYDTVCIVDLDTLNFVWRETVFAFGPQKGSLL